MSRTYRLTRLGLIVVGLIVGTRSAPLAAQAPLPPEPDRALARELLRELVEIDTTQSGNTTQAAEAMAARLRGAGFADEDIFIGGADPRKGNLVARLRRTGGPGGAPILLLAHLDVVEARPEDWSVDPFTLLERDGYFYGRGVTDDKDESAIHVANLIRLKREGVQPTRDVMIALTADEEGGPHNGVQWLLANHRSLIEAAFALNEGGGGQIKDGRRLANTVQASEKVYQSFSLEVRNPGGHSSLPRADNAIYQLARALVRIEAHAFPVRLNEVTRAYFERVAEVEGGDVGADMRAILRTPPEAAAVERLARRPEYNARMRTTCVATRLDAGHADNALPQTARALVNCRMLPDEDPAEVRRALERAIGDPAVQVAAIGSATPSAPSPLAPEIMRPIEQVTAEMWPGVSVVPTMSTGATDGLYLRNAGIPVYGVSGIFIDVDDVRAHGRDERIDVRAFHEGQEFLYRLVTMLSGGRRPPSEP